MTLKLTALRLVSATALIAGLSFPALAEAPPIKVGMTVSSSGAFALASQSGERGVEVWVKEVNDRGGISIGGEKRLIELVKRDDRSDKQMVARVYEDLINKDNVDVLMAPFGSTLTASAATISERYKMFMNVWSASADTVFQQGFNYLVSTTQMPASAVPEVPLDLAREKGLKRLAIVHIDEPYPASFAAAVTALAPQYGIEVVMDETYPKGTKDFSLMAQKAKAYDAEMFFFASYEGDQMSVAHQMKQMGISFPYVFMSYAVQPQFNEVGSAADYILSTTNFHESVSWPINAGLNREEFVTAYDTLYPNAEYAADFQTILAYGAGVVMEKIIEEAGTLDAVEMKKAALALNNQLTVLAGPYEIEESGMQKQMPWVAVQRLPDNKIVSVWPKEAASTEMVLTPAQ